MKRLIPLAALALLLTACQSRVPDAPTPSPSADSSRAPGESGPAAIPAAYHGTWDTGTAACARPGATSRRVDATSIGGLPGGGTVTSVRESGDGIEAVVEYSAEGQREPVSAPKTFHLVLTSSDRLTFTEAGTATALVRCPGEGAGGEESGGDVRSAYTRIAGCETLQSYEEGGGDEQRCPGYAGTPLYVTTSDLRVDVDAGVRNDAFTTPSAFNALGNTVEWRLRDGEPFAIIVRYEIEAGPGESPSSDLAVIKVGRDGAPGCLVGYVHVSAAPDQNTAARRLADRDAAAFDCAP